MSWFRRDAPVRRLREKVRQLRDELARLGDEYQALQRRVDAARSVLADQRLPLRDANAHALRVLEGSADGDVP